MVGSYRRVSTPSKPAKSSGAKPQSAKRNNSLLNFFQKADGPPQSTSRQARITQFTAQGERPGKRVTAPRPRLLKRETSSTNGGGGEEGLFLGDSKRAEKTVDKGSPRGRDRSRTPDDIWGLENVDDGKSLEGKDRFNENGSAVKRRKMDSTPANSSSAEKTAKKAQKVSGPFIDESDSEDEELEEFRDFGDEDNQEQALEKKNMEELATPSDGDQTARKRTFAADVPPLVREATSHMQDDEYPDFDDIEGDEAEGEEFFLGAVDGDEVKECEAAFDFDANDLSTNTPNTDETPTCPVCQGSLEGFDETVSWAIMNRVSKKLRQCFNRTLRRMSMIVSMENPARSCRRHQVQMLARLRRK